MVAKDSFQKYLDAGIAFTNLTRAKAEDLVSELVQNGEFQSSDARARVDELLERSRKGREAFAAQVRKEVAHQLESVGITSLDDLAQQVAALIGRTAEAGKAATSGAKAAATRSAAKRAPAKKTAAKKTAAKKTAAKKTRGQEDRGQEDRGQEDRGQEDRGQEDRADGSAHRHRGPRVVGLTNAPRRRLDRALVDRGLVASRPQAVARIEQGQVLVSGTVADKPSRMVSPAEPIELLGPPPRFVSRGGEKLDAALQRFAIEVTGRRALDAGASTGGFTDCLLQAGAASVVAVDVGRGQLHPRLRDDPRVDCRERLDIREVTLDTLGGTPVDLVTADLSFISATRAVPVLLGESVAPGSSLVILVKPQFEAGRVEASRGRGVIRDPDIHRRTLLDVTGALAAAGADIMGLMPSPITGSAGNLEFLLHARTPFSGPVEVGPANPAATVAGLVDRAVTEGHAENGPG